MKRRGAFAGALILIVALISGCADGASTAGETDPPVAPADRRPLGEIQRLDDPRSFVGESTATLADAHIEPVADDPAQSLPASVTSYDADGPRDMEIDDTRRVVAVDLAGSVAATVWGLGFGESLVGVDQSATFPGARDLSVVTSGGHTVNAEAIIALNPSVVITDGSVGPRDVLEQLRDVGIGVVFVENDASFGGAEELARQVAAVFGAPDAGAALADRIRTDVAAEVTEIAGIVPDEEAERLRMVFLYLRGASGVYYLFGTESGADELITALGGVDVASELGWDGMKPLTDEALVAADPDLILVMTQGIESVGGVDGLLESKPAIALTRAGQNRRFVDMDDGQILSFGPRSAQVLDALARAIYAPDAR